jgi:hypothetical protein
MPHPGDAFGAVRRDRLETETSSSQAPATYNRFAGETCSGRPSDRRIGRKVDRIARGRGVFRASARPYDAE